MSLGKRALKKVPSEARSNEDNTEERKAGKKAAFSLTLHCMNNGIIFSMLAILLHIIVIIILQKYIDTCK